MSQEEELEILKDAIYYFGISHQITKAIEEMAELTKELCKWKDGEDNEDHIAEEIADVLITIDQLILYFKAEEHIADIRKEKLHRLRQRTFEYRFRQPEL